MEECNVNITRNDGLSQQGKTSLYLRCLCFSQVEESETVLTYGSSASALNNRKLKLSALIAWAVPVES